jgi:plasmid maintenance system killer protein
VRCVWISLAIAFACVTSVAGLAQERAWDVTPCQLIVHPDLFTESLVTVDGIVLMDGDELTLHGGNCSDEHGRVRLVLGAAISRPHSKAEATTSKQPDDTSAVSSSLPLKKNRQYEKLQQMLQAAAATGKPRMVRAGLTGRFFAGRSARRKDGTVIHNDARLVIEEVESVGGESEAPVDYTAVAPVSWKAGKGCTVAELSVPSRDDEDQLERKSLEEEFAYLHDPREVAARVVAEQERITAEQAATRMKTLATTAALASYEWLSPDGTKSYSITVNKPYWLLQTAVTGDVVAWAPKQIILKVCAGTQQKSAAQSSRSQ